MEAKILVVDDEKSIRDLLGDFLTKIGYSADTVDSMKSALDQLRRTSYDIIITDKNMPDMEGNQEGGMTLLRYIKRYTPLSEVIMMTGYATIETATEAIKMGAFDYITKPFSLEALNEKINRVLEYKHFINSENTLQTYRLLHAELLSMLENRNDMPEDKLNKLLRSLGARIDQVFGSQKEFEKIIILQKEALENIASYAEHLKEGIPKTDPSYGIIEKISDEALRHL